MRKWKCVGGDEFSTFTIGKIYSSDDDGFNMVDDDGVVFKLLNVFDMRNTKFEEVVTGWKSKEETIKKLDNDWWNEWHEIVKPKDNKVLMHKEICDNLNKTFEKKNNDYGDSFSKSFEEFGLISAIVRISDKYRRLTELGLNNKKQQVDGEAIEDTLLDMANYCIMTYMELTKQKEEEVKNDN